MEGDDRRVKKVSTKTMTAIQTEVQETVMRNSGKA